jgi:hypothetical protein
VLAGANGRWPAAIRLVLDLDDRSEVVRTLEPAAPTGDPEVLAALLRGALEKESLASPVVALTLEATRTVPPTPIQRDLFEERAQPDPRARDAALSRLVGRYGPDAVVRPVPVDDPHPEKRAAFVPVKGKTVTVGRRSDRKRRRSPGPPIALRLAPDPTPVEVRLDGKGPVAVRWDGRWRRVVKRPWVESLRGRWWEEEDRERLDHRVVLEGGMLVWLAEDPKAKSWKLVGWYD